MVTTRTETAEPIKVPAEGDAFDFHIHAAYRWIGRQMSVPELRRWADRLAGWADQMVREQCADLARNHPPHRAWQLQRALNERLDGQSWERRIEGVVLKVVAQVRVLPDERVRESLRPYWEQRIKLEWEHELEKLQVRQADELTRRWREVLENLEHDPVTSHAAQLASDRFAKVFSRYAEERRKVVPDLVELLREAVKGHGDLAMGPSEYTEAWDAAIRTYQRQHGLTDDPQGLA